MHQFIQLNVFHEHFIRAVSSMDLILLVTLQYERRSRYECSTNVCLYEQQQTQTYYNRQNQKMTNDDAAPALAPKGGAFLTENRNGGT